MTGGEECTVLTVELCYAWRQRRYPFRAASPIVPDIPPLRPLRAGVPSLFPSGPGEKEAGGSGLDGGRSTLGACTSAGAGDLYWRSGPGLVMGLKTMV